MRRDCLLAIDVGKTHLKLSVVGPDGATLHEIRARNIPVEGEPYRHFDTARIWSWIVDSVGQLPERARIDAIVPVTHGAAVALIDERTLVLPVMDYEWPGVAAVEAEYVALRDDFEVTLSPLLANGLNVGKQLLWMQRHAPTEFARARAILTYPQYWSWRLCGVKAVEPTSLGCHTDLWSPVAGGFSPLVDRMGWRSLMPPIRAAADTLGPLLPALAEALGVSPLCRVLCGIHDNNASMLRHLGAAEAAPLAVVSSGTWVIVAGFGSRLSVLDARRDMLANVDSRGRAYPCARFMGGREFEQLNGDGPLECDESHVSSVLESGALALPSFSTMGGPFPDGVGRIIGPEPRDAHVRCALATLYCALVTDFCLSLLDAHGDIVVEGALTANRAYAALLAALRPGQRVRIADDRSGTTTGAWMLAFGALESEGREIQSPIWRLPDLEAYRNRWQHLVGQS